MFWLKQSTTVTVNMGPALDATDGVTEEEALSPTVRLSKNGAASAARNSATAITHDADGHYRVELNATDTNTLGRLRAYFQDPATHLPVWEDFMVVPANVYDSLVAGTDTLQSDVTQWLGTAVTASGGLPDVNVESIDDGILTAAKFAAAAFTASKFGSNFITSSSIATGAINATGIAADAIGASELATDAVNEIRDAILADSTAFNGADIAAILTDTGTSIPALIAALNDITAQAVADLIIPKKNTALSDIEFLMVDATDFTTPETGLTVSGTRSIDGGAFAAVTGTIAEVGNGIYQFDASAADMNGSIITFRFTATGAADRFVTIRTSG